MYVFSFTTTAAAYVGADTAVTWLTVMLQLVHVHYTGVIEITPALSAILGGSPASKTTAYGHSCMSPRLPSGKVKVLMNLVINVTFESGCERYKSLETGVFVGAGHFVIDERGLSSEYKVSKVVAGRDASKGGGRGGKS